MRIISSDADGAPGIDTNLITVDATAASAATLTGKGARKAGQRRVGIIQPRAA
jgi:hypothetical protein